MFKVPESKLTYSKKPEDTEAYTKKMDKIYTRYAKAYDGFIALFPLWKKWIGNVLPYVKGKTILEVSFGPGYLLTRYPKKMVLHGLDYNALMVKRAKEKMIKAGREGELIQGNVEGMPYPDNSFDTVVNTMAFTGYPDGEKALDELIRVLKPGGVLLILDYDFPKNRNIFGYWFVRFIEKCGDIIKDIGGLIEKTKCTYERKIIGGFGSIQLFIIKKHMA